MTICIILDSCEKYGWEERNSLREFFTHGHVLMATETCISRAFTLLGDGGGKKKKAEDVSKIKCFNCRQLGHRADDCPKPDTRPDADKSKKVDGSKSTKSPSNEKSGYTARHHADPSADKAARDVAERSSRHVQRKEGGQ